MIFVSFGVPFHPEFKGTKVGGPLIIVFGMMPWALLAKGISDFGKAVIGRRDGLTASRAASYCRDFFDVDVKPDLCYPDVTVYQDCECMLPIADLIWILFLAFIGYSLVGIYLDNVLPQENGTRRSPWFFMDPAYWSPRFGSLFARLWRPALLRVRLEGASCHSEDDDVQAEFRRLKERLGRIQRGEEGDQSNTDAIELFGVRRIFRRGLLGLVGAPFEVKQ